LPSQVEVISHCPTVHVYGAPAHVPAPLQTSPLVQALPSLHVAPLDL